MLDSRKKQRKKSYVQNCLVKKGRKMEALRKKQRKKSYVKTCLVQGFRKLIAKTRTLFKIGFSHSLDRWSIRMTSNQGVGQKVLQVHATIKEKGLFQDQNLSQPLINLGIWFHLNI